MTYFIKVVDDLNDVCTKGINEHFFRGEGYVPLSDDLAEPVRRWCQTNLSVVKLKSEGATEDDPIEVYVIRFGEKLGVKELKNLMIEVGKTLVGKLSSITQKIDTKNVMRSETNAHFDALEEAARLRTFLIKVAGNRRHGPASAVLLDV